MHSLEKLNLYSKLNGMYSFLIKKLKPVLPPFPKCIYRKAPSFGDRIVKKKCWIHLPDLRPFGIGMVSLRAGGAKLAGKLPGL